MAWKKYFKDANLSPISGEKVPNFAKAVDHFNNLSYWTQGIILSQTKDSQDLREKIIWKVN